MSMAILGVFLLMVASTSTAPTPGDKYLVIKLPANLLQANQLPRQMLPGKMLPVEMLEHTVCYVSFGYQGTCVGLAQAYYIGV